MNYVARTLVGPKVRKYNYIEDIPKSGLILNYFSTYLQFGISNYSILPSKNSQLIGWWIVFGKKNAELQLLDTIKTPKREVYELCSQY